MLKKIMMLFLALGMLLVFSGCNKSTGNENLGFDDDADIYKNSIVPIYNARGEEIGSITCFGYSVLANNNILYVRLPENASSTSTLEYCLYDIENKENYPLTTVEDWYYEEIYEALETNDHLYLSISTGSYYDFENGKLTIYDVDLLEHSMSPILEIEGAVPYNSYTIANNKLILAELLYNGHTDLVEFDLSEPHTSTVVHKYDETDYFTQNSIRHIYADSKNIYMVRLAWNEADNYSLCLDTYDFDYNLLNTVDISDFCVSTDIERTEDTKINEWKQTIAYFFVHNDLVYYQNFSTTNAIGVLGSDRIDRLFETNARFSYVSSSNSDEHDLFIQTFGNKAQDRNIFYRLNSETHRIETAEFFPDNLDYTFVNAFRDNNKILLTMGYNMPPDKSERLPDRLYYIDMNDLDFKPME